MECSSEVPKNGTPIQKARRSTVISLLLERVGRCDSAVERGSGHAHVFGYLCGGFAGVDEALGVLDLAGGELQFSSAEVLSGSAAFADAVGDAFSFDVQFHLSQSRHDGEHHGSHWGAGIDVVAAEVQHT